MHSIWLQVVRANPDIFSAESDSEEEIEHDVGDEKGVDEEFIDWSEFDQEWVKFYPYILQPTASNFEFVCRYRLMCSQSRNSIICKV